MAWTEARTMALVTGLAFAACTSAEPREPVKAEAQAKAKRKMKARGRVEDPWEKGEKRLRRDVQRLPAENWESLPREGCRRENRYLEADEEYSGWPSPRERVESMARWARGTVVDAAGKEQRFELELATTADSFWIDEPVSLEWPGQKGFCDAHAGADVTVYFRLGDGERHVLPGELKLHNPFAGAVSAPLTRELEDALGLAGSAQYGHELGLRVYLPFGPESATIGARTPPPEPLTPEVLARMRASGPVMGASGRPGTREPATSLHLRFDE